MDNLTACCDHEAIPTPPAPDLSDPKLPEEIPRKPGHFLQAIGGRSRTVYPGGSTRVGLRPDGIDHAAFNGYRDSRLLSCLGADAGHTGGFM